MVVFSDTSESLVRFSSCQCCVAELIDRSKVEGVVSCLCRDRISTVYVGLKGAGKLRHQESNLLPQNFQAIYQPRLELLLLLCYTITIHFFPLIFPCGILTLSLSHHVTQLCQIAFFGFNKSVSRDLERYQASKEPAREVEGPRDASRRVPCWKYLRMGFTALIVNLRCHWMIRMPLKTGVAAAQCEFQVSSLRPDF